MSLFPYAFLILAASLPIRARFHELAATESQKKGLPAVEYITASTSNNDYVLVWGAEAGINFSSRRQSPTRFVYQYPLYTRGYQSVHMIEEFLDDIRTNEPALIVDTSPSNGRIPPIDVIARQEWKSSHDSYDMLPEMDLVFDYIATRYELKGSID